MRTSKQTLINLSGLSWMIMGGFLLFMGSRFLIKSDVTEQLKITFLVSALIIGFLKGKFVLAKSVKRQIKRISELSGPIFLKNIYSKAYYLLILLMIGLGISLRYCPLYVRGSIDIAVGMALIQGATLFFRFKKTVQGNCS